MISFPYQGEPVFENGIIVGYDRAITAQSQQDFYRLLYSNGVDYRNPNAYKVTSLNNGMKVSVAGSTGDAPENKAWAFVGFAFALEESVQVEVELEAAHSSYSRIDRIVLRADLSTENRNVTYQVLKGTPSSNPEPVSPTRSTTIHEIALADITVPANSTIISDSNIFDLRLDNELCGTLGNAFFNPDMSPYFVQIQSKINDLNEAIAQALSGALPDNSVTTPKIFDGAVTTEKLADGSITNEKLAATFDVSDFDTNAIKIQGTPVSDTAPIADQVLAFAGTQINWVKLSALLKDAVVVGQTSATISSAVSSYALTVGTVYANRKFIAIGMIQSYSTATRIAEASLLGVGAVTSQGKITLTSLYSADVGGTYNFIYAIF